MTNHPIEGVACVPKENNLGIWSVFIEGPKGSPFEGGVFELEMAFPSDYPDNPPTLYFKSEFWHPNIYPDGKVRRERMLVFCFVISNFERCACHLSTHLEITRWTMRRLIFAGSPSTVFRPFWIRCCWFFKNPTLALLRISMRASSGRFGMERDRVFPLIFFWLFSFQRQFPQYKERIAELCKKSKVCIVVDVVRVRKV